MKQTSNTALEQYRRQLTAWVEALAVADNEAVKGDVGRPFSVTDIDLFTEGNLDKRTDILDLQTAFLRPAFDDLDDLIAEYILTVPMASYGGGPPDGAAFLRWLTETIDLTPEQADHVACRMGRYAVEDAARENRKGHIRFQERLSVAKRLAAELASNNRLRVHLNPALGWATLVTNALLDDETAPPTRVVFFAVGMQIRTAVLDEPVPSLLETLRSENGLTLEQWAECAEIPGPESLVELTGRLVDLGLVALS